MRHDGQRKPETEIRGLGQEVLETGKTVVDSRKKRSERGTRAQDYAVIYNNLLNGVKFSSNRSQHWLL